MIHHTPNSSTSKRKPRPVKVEIRLPKLPDNFEFKFIGIFKGRSFYKRENLDLSKYGMIIYKHQSEGYQYFETSSKIILVAIVVFINDKKIK